MTWVGDQVFCSLSKMHCFAAQRNWKFVPSSPRAVRQQDQLSRLCLHWVHLSQLMDLGTARAANSESTASTNFCNEKHKAALLLHQHHRDTEFMLIFNVVESSFPITAEQLQNFSCKTPISTLFLRVFLGLEKQKLKETGLLSYPQPPEQSPAHSWVQQSQDSAFVPALGVTKVTNSSTWWDRTWK